MIKKEDFFAPGIAEEEMMLVDKELGKEQRDLMDLEQKQQSEWDSYLWNIAKQTGKDVDQITDKDLETNFKDLYKTSEEKVRQEIIEAGPKRYKKKERFVFPGSSDFGEDLFTLWPPHFKERQRLHNLSEEELKQHNLERGYQPWEDVVGCEPLSPLHMKRLYGRWGKTYENLGKLFNPQQMAGGGLASLTRTVAPDSGPMSHGLRSLYIDDKDY